LSPKKVWLNEGRDEMPTIFTVTRDPIERFASFFFYIRSTATNWGLNLYKKHYSKRWKSVKEWRKQDINECILKEESECSLDNWQRDFYLVIVSNY